MSYNTKANKTELFLVPPLGIPKYVQREHGFIGAYLKDEDKPEINYERGIFLLFHSPNMALFNEWVEEEKTRTPWLMEDYDYDGGYVVLVYNMEERLGRDFERVLEGKYSKLSREFKEKFSKTVIRKTHMGKSITEPSWQWRIFNKDAEIRKHWEDTLDVVLDDDMEVWSKPTMSEETLNIGIIKGETKNIV